MTFDTRMNSPGIYLEISSGSLKALHGEEGLELLLERTANGRLSEACKERTIAALRNFLQLKSWQPRPRAYCAIGASGVSLRRIKLPAASKEETQRLLRMQIESEFPLAPDELAWGSRALGELRQNGTTQQELLVMALKKDVIEEYATLLSDCGLTPLFTLAALARSAICPQAAGSYGILDVADSHSELVLFNNGVPSQVRTLALHNGQPNLSPPALDSLTKALNGSWSGKRLFVSGSDVHFAAISKCVNECFSNDLECAPLPITPGKGRSSAICGIKQSVESGGASLLLFESQPAHGKTHLNSRAPMKWAVIAAALVFGLALLPYAKALLLKPRLVKKLIEFKAKSGQLTTIDRELGFLQFLKQNQPPYLDALYLFAKAAPQGAKIDSLTMNRRGEIALRGTMRNGDQVADFRTKLIDSKFFAKVTVEEQTTTPDRQKVNVRITAQWKPLSTLQALVIGPSADELEQAKKKKDSPPGGMSAGFSAGMPPGAMPAGFPAGFLPPGAMPPNK